MVAVNPALTQDIQQLVESAPEGSIVSVMAQTPEGAELVRINGDHLHRAASTIKIPILIGLARAVDAGRLDLAEKQAIAQSDRVQGSGVLYWLDPAIELSLRDFAWLMIADSDNTASNVLIEAVGQQAIAQAIADLGVLRSGLNRKFLGRSPEKGAPDNIVSADDLVILLNGILNDTAASPEMCGWMREVLGQQKYTACIPRYLPEGLSWAGKTGWVTGVNHDCGFMTGPGGTITVATLTTGFIEDRYAAQVLMGEVGRRLAEEIR